MKTLDEVIHALEICASSYCSNHDGDCPYLGHYKCNEEQRNLDALHYLKEYKANQEDPDGDHQQLEKARALLQEFYRNDPLSWDELKSMDGKPVWVKWTVKGEWHHGDWNLVNAQLGDRVWLVDGNGEEFDLLKDVQGVMWQAYGKERE